MTVAGSSLVAVGLDEHARLGPDMDVVGVPLGDVDEDPDDVGAVDHVDRRGARRATGRGTRCIGRGVAGGGQDEVARCWRCGPRSCRRRGR